jgi:hypothetical protein
LWAILAKPGAYRGNELFNGLTYIDKPGIIGKFGSSLTISMESFGQICILGVICIWK